MHDGALSGSTTDEIGVLGPLKRRLDVKGRSVVIIGAGGAARAAAVALQRKGSRVTLAARQPDKAATVAGVLGCAHASIADLGRVSWDVLINATPVGSVAFPDQSPLPAKLHRPKTVVLDMVYEPLETRFLRDAQQAGCTIIDGLEMLLAQAVAQFETWTGLEAPVAEMRSAALFLAQEQEA